MTPTRLDRFDRLARWLGAPRGTGTPLAHPAVAGFAPPDDPTCQPVLPSGFCSGRRTKQPKPGHVPTHNGCGPEGGTVRVPQGYGDAPFTDSCNGHDHCYENCLTDKDECDDTFLGGMVASCEQTYTGILGTLDRGWCMNMAVAYWQAVAQGGDAPWAAAQVLACDCCGEDGGCGREGARC